MRLFEGYAKDTAKQKNMVKTSIVGFCYGCQSAHYKEETFKENGDLYCKRTGRFVDTKGFGEPEIVEADPDWFEVTTEAAEHEDPKPLSRAEQIEDHMESLAMLFEIDIEKHQKHWEYLVSQFIALADTKQPRVAKKINKAALGTQLTLLEQGEESEVER